MWVQSTNNYKTISYNCQLIYFKTTKFDLVCSYRLATSYSLQDLMKKMGSATVKVGSATVKAKKMIFSSGWKGSVYMICRTKN